MELSLHHAIVSLMLVQDNFSTIFEDTSNIKAPMN